MRDIKFRGQRIDNKEWVCGSLIICSLRYGSGYLIHTYALDEEDKDEEIEVYHPTIGQFTGLQDKNGVDIYEGDVISFNYADFENPVKCTVEYHAPSFTIPLNIEVKVIDNIHTQNEQL